jgi:hypothetical protein
MNSYNKYVTESIIPLHKLMKLHKLHLIYLLINDYDLCICGTNGTLCIVRITHSPFCQNLHVQYVQCIRPPKTDTMLKIEKVNP